MAATPAHVGDGVDPLRSDHEPYPAGAGEGEAALWAGSTDAAYAGDPSRRQDFAAPAEIAWVPVEPWAAPPPPIPLLAPFIGLAASVLCLIGGGWLLLAPYALDYARATAPAPSGTRVDVATGAAVAALAAATALLFALALVRRLHGARSVPSADEPFTDSDMDATDSADADDSREPGDGGDRAALDQAAADHTEHAESERTPDSASAATEAGAGAGAHDSASGTSAPEPEPASAPLFAPPPPLIPGPDQASADAAGALRELLTPLVAALAADLRSHAARPAQEASGAAASKTTASGTTASGAAAPSAHAQEH